MSITKKKRFDVFKRDRFTCQYCGRKPPEAILELDHVTPKSKGGGDDLTNLTTSCFDCNRGKTNNLLTEIPATVTEEIERRRDAAEQVKAYDRFLKKQRKDEDKAIQRLAETWDTLTWRRAGVQVEHDTFRDDYRRSLRTFLRRLPETEVLDAMEIVVSRKNFDPTQGDEQIWKYFCGVCWTKIKGD